MSSPGYRHTFSVYLHGAGKTDPPPRPGRPWRRCLCCSLRCRRWPRATLWVPWTSCVPSTSCTTSWTIPPTNTLSTRCATPHPTLHLVHTLNFTNSDFYTLKILHVILSKPFLYYFHLNKRKLFLKCSFNICRKLKVFLKDGYDHTALKFKEACWLQIVENE